MTTGTAEVKKSLSAVTKVVTQLDYLKEKFQREAGEYKVDYKDVGPNRFRVNFWAYKPLKAESLSQFRGSFISRSYYVILKRNHTSWTHTSSI
jgi:hypothetical protein